MKLNELIRGFEYDEIVGDLQKEISSIAYDSRKAQKNSLFVAITGTKVDGHNFIPELLKKGINAIICQKIPDDLTRGDTTIIKVKDSRKALAIISGNWFDEPTKELDIIGVTGTNGKTTITYLLKEIYENAGKKVGVIGTTGIFMENEVIPATHTTPESLELMEHFAIMKNKGIDTVIMEVSSHALHQHRVAGVSFNSALFTNLTHDHLDYHKTYKNYAQAKKMLFEMLPANSVAVSNFDDEYGNYMLKKIKSKTKVSVGRNEDNDFVIKNEQLGLHSSTYELHHTDEVFKIVTPLIGRFNIDNTADAFVLAYKNGISADLIINAISKCTGAPGRMQRVLLKNGAIGIVDYAHTPDALEKALEACRELNLINDPYANLFCVFGCGGDRDKTKRSKMGKIAVFFANPVIITDDNPRTEIPEDIINDIISDLDVSDKHKTIIIADRAEAIKFAVSNSNKNDIILVAGKGHENYQIYGTSKNHFDDVEELNHFT